MAWMRTVAGRIKGDYRYSAKVVYNNFPWPRVTADQQAKIAETAQQILDARALYPDSSYADLYDERTMPSELRKAHQNNDRAFSTPRIEYWGYGGRLTPTALGSRLRLSRCTARAAKLFNRKIFELNYFSFES